MLIIILKNEIEKEYDELWRLFFLIMKQVRVYVLIYIFLPEDLFIYFRSCWILN